MKKAELARFIDRFTVEYVRLYPHPIERVWRAITDPAEFGQWLFPGTLELRVGGAFSFEPGGDFSGVLQALEPPRLIRFGFPDDQSYFQYELSEAAEGTRMRFVQHFAAGHTWQETPDDLGGDLPAGPQTPWKPGFVGGWHEFWDSLGDYLDGVPLGSRLPPSEFGALARAWARHAPMYHGLTPSQADEIVRSLRRQERWNELNKIYREHIKTTLPA